MAYTHTELADNVKVKGMIPTNQQTYTSARLLTVINDAMTGKILPLVIKRQENFYSYDIDFSVNATGEYPIPSRAIGAKVQNVALINGTERLDLPWLSEEELTDTDVSPVGTPGFFIKRNSVWIVPKSPDGYPTVRMTIFLRPARLVTNEEAAQITAINTGTKTISFSSCPSSWSTSSLFELVQQHPHFDTLAYDQVITAITSTTMTFSSALPSRLAVGDWVSLTGETPVVQCPMELQPLLAWEAAAECLQSLSKTEALKNAQVEIKKLMENLGVLVSPRVEKEGKKLVSRSGMLRRSR